MQVAEDVTGRVFGSLTVLEMIPPMNGEITLSKCLCECGNIKNIPPSRLLNGTNVTCGCGKAYIVERKTLNCLNAEGIEAKNLAEEMGLSKSIVCAALTSLMDKGEAYRVGKCPALWFKGEVRVKWIAGFQVLV